MAGKADKLDRYRAKRSFDRTPEPQGAKKADSGSEPSRETVASGRFVVQQHDATNLHWDLRLEHEGVALSWALPRGIPALPDRAANRLAVHTEDHPLEYLEFQGDIPKGRYGGGTMGVWDAGTFEASKLRDDEVIATFSGQRMIGAYALFRTRGKNWIIHRIDPPLDPGREPFPGEMKPMQAVRGDLPADRAAWAYEIDWAGLRTLVWCEPGHIKRSLSRGLEAETVRVFPELRRIAREVGHLEVVLDGEVVVVGDDRAPVPKRLTERKSASSESVAKRLGRDHPSTFQIFDVLFCDGHSTLELPYEERRDLLEELDLGGAAWATPANHRGDPAALLHAAGQRGLASIIAKKLAGTYRPGRRSDEWVKVSA